MADPLKARLPCLEHGRFECELLLDIETDEQGLQIGAQQEFCPGGREVLLVPTTPDLQAGLAYLRSIRGLSMFRNKDLLKAVDAAVGDTWTIEEVDE